MNTFIQIHVAISVIALVSGFIVLLGLLEGHSLNRWTAVFLTMTVATSVTGFCFLPFDGFTPAQAFGILSMVLLILAIIARYSKAMAGPWRKVYVVTAVAALYLNFFVLIVQSFEKIPMLKAAAPTQKEPPFIAAQSAALMLFVIAGFFAVKRFRSSPPVGAQVIN